MRNWFFAGILALACVLGFQNSASSGQVPEIPDPGLNDISMAQMTPNGPVIYYNPIRCAQVGPLVCEFFRAHEYGHVTYGDSLGSTFPPLAEMRADCFAAQQVTPAVVLATVQFFTAMGLQGDASHGTGFQRAQRVNDMRLTGNCHF